VKIAVNNGNDEPTSGLETGDDVTGSRPDRAVTSLVLVRQNARHLFESETEVTSSSEGAVVGSSLSELIVVQDECAGCLPLAAMLRPQRSDNHLSAGTVAPPPETGTRSRFFYRFFPTSSWISVLILTFRWRHLYKLLCNMTSLYISLRGLFIFKRDCVHHTPKTSVLNKNLAW